MSREERLAAIHRMTSDDFDFDEMVAQAEAGEYGVQADEHALVTSDKKPLLADVPFFVIGAEMREGNYGSYVSVTCLLRTKEIVVFNDGGTGIVGALEALPEIPTPDKPLFVRGGLRVSKYEYLDENTGKKIPAETWYFNFRKTADQIEGLNRNGVALSGKTRETRASA